MKERNAPKCKRKNCNFNSEGRCIILTSSDFNGRECTFFKDKEEGEPNDK